MCVVGVWFVVVFFDEYLVVVEDVVDIIDVVVVELGY